MRARALSALRYGNFEDHSNASGERKRVAVLREFVFGGQEVVVFVLDEVDSNLHLIKGGVSCLFSSQ